MLNNAHITPVIPVSNLDRARKYYSEVLGLQEIGPHGGNVAFGDPDGDRIELVYKPDAVASENTLLTFEVDDVASEVEALSKRGVKFEPIDLPGATRDGVITTLEGENIAWLKDSEGNWLCLHEEPIGEEDIEPAPEEISADSSRS